MPLNLLRYPRLGPSLWSFDHLPSGATTENISLTAEDRGESLGVLYRRGAERTVVCIMHPRSDMSRHYAVPALLEAGYAVFGQTGRWVNNDIGLIHEMLLTDVAAGLHELRSRGFERIVLFGNSAGGALYSFYQSQAATKPPGRLTDTAAGDPYDLNAFELPVADGLVQLAAHLGQGMLMLGCIDPSVVREDDPLSIDPELDMFHPRNGFREPPESSAYSTEFVARYRAAQRGRIARIDAIARHYISMQRHFRQEMDDEHFEGLALEQREFVWRRALAGRFMEVNRTEANPAYCDLSIHRSERDYGSFLTPRPDAFNYSEAGLGKYQSPRAWLSTWSGLTSRAATLACIPKVSCPTLVVAYANDNLVFIPDSDAIHAASGASDKQLHLVDGDHLGLPPRCKPGTNGREAAMKIVARWLRERFPAA
ncbi:MAG: alpha/beta hydrolase [Deltaproteobacteria bacterium]|nr:alpha/beta hydrolase [Deltaproteobacteria bacterium]